VRLFILRAVARLLGRHGTPQAALAALHARLAKRPLRTMQQERCACWPSVAVSLARRQVGP
jgi:hypothetical protein